MEIEEFASQSLSSTFSEIIHAMARIPLPDLEKLTIEQQSVVDTIRKMGSRNGRLPAPYQLSLANPEFTNIWQQMGSLLRYRNSLPLRLSELAILITARYWNCRYEWFAHAPIGIKEGLSSTVVESISLGVTPNFEKQDELKIFQFTSELHEKKTVSLEVHNDILNTFGQIGIVDLTGLIGYYAMVAMVLNVHDFTPPEGSEFNLPFLKSIDFKFSTFEKT